MVLNTIGSSVHAIRSIWSQNMGPDYYTNYYIKQFVGTVAVRLPLPSSLKKTRARKPT